MPHPCLAAGRQYIELRTMPCKGDERLQGGSERERGVRRIAEWSLLHSSPRRPSLVTRVTRALRHTLAFADMRLTLHSPGPGERSIGLHQRQTNRQQRSDRVLRSR